MWNAGAKELIFLGIFPKFGYSDMLWVKKQEMTQRIDSFLFFQGYIIIIVVFVVIYFFCKWVYTRWQQYSTHLNTNSIQNTDNETYIPIKKFRKCGPCPVFAGYNLAFALQLRGKNTEKPQLG
jgi:hypothetical protein